MANSAFIKDLIINLAGYSAMAFSYFGWGWIISRALKFVFHPKEKPFAFVWLGWASTLFLLQLVNLIFPINIFVSILFLFFGTIFALVFFRLKLRFKDVLAIPKIPLILTIVAAVWLAALSMFSPTSGDSGLYHFNAIRWLNEYPIVLGLVNLHNRLAFNQSFFAYAAYLDLYPFFHRGFSLANSFLLLTLLSECIFSLASPDKSTQKSASFTPINRVAIYFIPFLIYYAFFTQYSLYYPKYTDISSPSPDTASFILQILMFIYFIREIKDTLSDSNKNSRIALILILASTTITIKLSNAIFVTSLCVILIILRLKKSALAPKQNIQTINKLAIFPALIIILWCLRGIGLSGCPAYPSTIGCIKADWAAPIESVKNEADLIYSWARLPEGTPDQVLSSWAWLYPWSLRIWENKVTKAMVVYPLIISVITLLTGFIIYVFKLSSHKIDKRIFLLPLPAVIGLLYWFFSAPAVRFAEALFWILPISMLIVLSEFFEAHKKIGIAMIVIIFLIANASLGKVFFDQYRMFSRFPAGYQPIPVAQLTKRTTNSGLEVWTPTQDDKCWNSSLPCTPYFDPGLKFIDNRIFPKFISTDPPK